MSEAVQERWQGFVQKVTGRWGEVMQEAQAGFDGLLADPDLDPYAFLNAMNAIELRYKELGSKLQETYSQQVVMQLGARSGNAEALLHESLRWLSESFARFRVGQNGRLARHLWTRVQTLMQSPVACSQCGGHLTKTLLHQAETLTCGHCRAVNSVTPHPLVYTYFSMAPDWAAEEQTLESNLALERAELADAPREQVEALARSHWEAYVRARSQVVPMAPEEQRMFVESRLEMRRRYA